MSVTARMLFAALAVVCWSAASTWAAPKRIALVIGNSAYQSTNPLPNARSDARAIADLLGRNGFRVTTLSDARRPELGRALSEFSAAIAPGDIALFFYAGHGMQLRGENFLLGVDAKLENEFDVAAETIALDAVIGALERKAAVALVFIDACRNNPLADRLNNAIEGVTRGGETRGLAPIATTASGTMVAFAASPGQVAYDGGNGTSPFTAALVRHLMTPSLEVGTAFKRVIRDVREQTGGRQSPQIVSNLAEEIYLNPSEPAASAPTNPVAIRPDATPPASQPLIVGAAPKPNAPSSPISSAALDFAKAERIATARGWQLFLAKHESGAEADAARRKLEELGGTGFTSPQEAEQRLNLTLAQRREVQLRLTDLGYEPGSADGSFGTRTRREIARYQKAMGLTETGFVNNVTIRRLEIVGIAPGDVLVSAAEARRYDPADLEGLESDPRVIKAAQCLKGKEFIYGTFEGHLYAAVHQRNVTWGQAASAARNCETSLVGINSAAENGFVYGLFESDDRMFYSDTDDGWTYKLGPWIGLVQDQGGREPKGGWSWQGGASLAYANWLPGKPDELSEQQDVAMFFGEQRGDIDPRRVDARRWNDQEPQGVTTHSYVLEFE